MIYYLADVEPLTLAYSQGIRLEKRMEIMRLLVKLDWMFLVLPLICNRKT